MEIFPSNPLEIDEKDWETKVICDIGADRDILDEDGFNEFFTKAGREARKMPKLRRFHVGFAYQWSNTFSSLFTREVMYLTLPGGFFLASAQAMKSCIYGGLNSNS